MSQIFSFSIVITLCLLSSCFGQEYPNIISVSNQVYFTEPVNAELKININDINSKPAYTLSCKSGDIDDSDFNFSGLFHCRLVSLYSKETVSSLLIEDRPQTADWEGRARFLLNHVVGKCAQVPDWGAKRIFRVRNMMIVLEIQDVKIKKGLEYNIVESYKFSYKVMPDNEVVSSISLKSKVSEPWWFASGTNCINEVN